MNVFATGELLGDLDVGGVVPGFRLEQPRVKLGEFWIGGSDMFGKQTKTLAATGLDERSDQQTIDGADRVRWAGPAH